MSSLTYRVDWYYPEGNSLVMTLEAGTLNQAVHHKAEILRDFPGDLVTISMKLPEQWLEVNL
jgi:hypothetical protein